MIPEANTPTEFDNYWKVMRKSLMVPQTLFDYEKVPIKGHIETNSAIQENSDIKSSDLLELYRNSDIETPEEFINLLLKGEPLKVPCKTKPFSFDEMADFL